MRSTRRTLVSLLGIAWIGLGAGTLSAQTLFQNNNQPCELEPVLCSTSSCTTPNVNSLSCRNVNRDGTFADADFDGDGFADCVAVRQHSPVASSPPQPESQASVLLNRGTSATACSPGPGDQFSPSLTYTVTGSAESSFLSNVVTGDLNGGGTDFIIPNIASGSQNLAIALNAGGGFGPSNSTLTSVDRNWAVNTQFGFEDFFGQRSLALLDCNNDSALDAAMVVEESSPTPNFKVNVLRNDGSGLQAIAGVSDSFDTHVATSDSDHAALTVADFNNDANLDLALLLFVNNSDTGPVRQVATICLNDGNCNFTCPNTPTIDLTDLHPGKNIEPVSIESGDFDGDGNNDIVVSEPGLPSSVPTPEPQGIQYYFGNGNASFPRNLFAPYNVSGNRVSVLTTGCYNNDNVRDVAVVGEDSEADNSVGVFTSDGSGGVHTPVILSGADLDTFRGIDSVDFDHAGGDDIAVIGQQYTTITSEVIIFLNSLETLSAIAGPDQTVLVNVPLAISGASCSVSPEITGDPARFDVQWTVTASPPGASPALSGATTLTPTFQSATPGAYTLQLECRTRCTSTATDTKIVTVVAPAVPTPSATPFISDTQGGCLADLNPGGGEGTKWSWALPLLAMAFWLLRRMKRKTTVLGILFLTLLGVGRPAHALTDSFSVNTFQPTVDDSEYFTIYGSPTMLQRNFHVGFYLDYAHHPYEFGSANFNRTAGIVDHLITGNIMGSYAVLDWMSVGVVIPVYFWEGIRSPALGDSNHFDLGDIQLVLKFRLLDREKHHVGVAIVPFMVFPSSTGAGNFLGNGSFAGGGKLVIDGRIKDRVSLALNVGYLVRSQVFDVGGNELNDQFLAGMGISIDILKEKLKLIGEADFGTVANNFFTRRTTPAEARVGFRYTWAHNHDLNVGGGFGLSNGIGSPDFRAFVGYTYTKRPVAEVAVPQPPVSEVQVGDELTAQDKIYFEFDKAQVREISKPTLDKIAGFMKAHPEVTKVKIDGYTCDLGTDRYNMRLSDRRANAVAEYLKGQGIAPDRVGTVAGHGEANPLVPNKDEPSREQNRRVQIFVEAVQK